MVLQTRSPIRRHHAQRETLIGLGLNGIRRGRVLPDTPETRGMIRKVQHLVQVFEGPLMGKLTQAMKNDLETLRRFNRRVSRTEQSAFWKRYANQIPRAISRMDNMRLETTGPTSFAMEGIIHSVLEDFDQDEISWASYGPHSLQPCATSCVPSNIFARSTNRCLVSPIPSPPTRPKPEF